MQTRFTDYLISLRTDESGQYLKTIKNCVAAALEEKESGLGKLGGIFKRFPRQYADARAIPQNTWQQYYNACKHLINFRCFKHTFNAEFQRHISNLVQNILMTGMEELFDVKGRFKEDVIELLDLQKILDIYKDQPEKLLLIKQQILYAYFSEIVLTNLTIELHELPNLEKGKIVQLLRCMQYKVVNYIAEFTDFFQQITKKRLCHNTALEKEMAAAIKSIPVHRMIGIVMADLEKERGAFWQEVLYWLLQDANGFLYCKSLSSLLGANLDVETQAKVNNYLKQHASSEIKIPQVEEKEDAMQTVKHLISARNNALLLQCLIDEVQRLRAVPANRNFVDEITKAQRDVEFLKKMTAADLLLNFALVAQTCKCEQDVTNIVENLRKSVQSSPTHVSTMFPPAQRRGSTTPSTSTVAPTRP
jgi:hypothetical protein